MFKDEQDQPNTILNRFDCLHSDVNNESWEELRENLYDENISSFSLESSSDIWEQLTLYFPGGEQNDSRIHMRN